MVQAGIDVQRSLDEVVSSPDQTPSFITMEDRLKHRLRTPNQSLVERMGRDFGGSASGNTSQAGSDTEFSGQEEREGRRAGVRLEARIRSNDEKNIAAGQGLGHSPGPGLLLRKVSDREKKENGSGRAMADALGDQSDVGSDGAGEEADTEDLVEAERRDRSVKGSVY